jgi:CHAT domain-containing protein/Tfp pilus assembly protein PilF
MSQNRFQNNPTPLPSMCAAFSLSTLLFLLGCLINSSAAPARAVQGSQEPPLLEQGQTVERELAGGQVHPYRLMLAAEQYSHLVVEQKGIDVVATLFGPDGTKLFEVDSPNGANGPEPVYHIAASAGTYRLEVRSLDPSAQAGRYQVRIEELRPATTPDRHLVAAERLFSEAAQLQAEATAESLPKAIEKYKAAVPLYHELGNRVREAMAMNTLGLISDDLGRKKDALEYYRQTLPIVRELGARGEEAAVLSNIATVYSDLGENEKALDFYNQALAIQQAIGERIGESITLNNLGGVYQDLGEPQKAIDYYQRSLEVGHQAGFSRQDALTLNNIGVVYQSLDEAQKAIGYYNQALKLWRADRDRRGEARGVNNLGVVYLQLGDYQLAFDFFTQALQLRRDVGDRLGESTTLYNIGKTYNELGDKAKALEHLNQSLAIQRVIGDRQREARTLNLLGNIYDDLGEGRKALEANGQALRLNQASGNREGIAVSLNNIGKSYDVQGDKTKAGDYYNRSLALRRDIGDRSGEAATLYNLAHLDLERGNLATSRKTIEAALAILESVRSSVYSPDLRASFFASVQDYHEFYINLLMRLHQQQPKQGFDALALGASERARARSLLELLTESGADIRQGVDLALLERERALQLLLNAKAERRRRIMSQEHTEEQAEAIGREIERVSDELRQVELQIRLVSPHYASLTQPRLLSLSEIQRDVLDSQTILLEFSLGRDRSYLWAVTPTSSNSYELPGRAEIDALARRAYGLLTERNKRLNAESAEQRRARVARADDEYEEVAGRLSNMLLKPVAGLIGKKRLLIVSDGALQLIPFAALPLPSANAGGPTDSITFTPLILDHEIVYLPSASTLTALRSEMAGRGSVSRTVAVLADPVFDAADTRVKDQNSLVGRQPPAINSSSRSVPQDIKRAIADINESGDDTGLPRLLATRWEAQQIGSLVPASESLLALDFKASREVATSGLLSQYRIVHFATHAFIDDVHPELSGIVLSLVNEQGQPQDGFLRVHEIFNLKLPVELVVLSACKTGLGKDVRGEGLVGLTRGFMYAGVPRVVVSLWSLSDKPTAELMSLFYKKMLGQERRPAAAALRAAQIETWKNKRLGPPYFWAGFTFQGKWR